jgi:hypothetical protein
MKENKKRKIPVFRIRQFFYFITEEEKEINMVLFEIK